MQHALVVLIVLSVLASASIATVEPITTDAEFGCMSPDRNFDFEMDGKPILVRSVDPGAFRTTLENTTKGNAEPNYKNFEVTETFFGTWRIEKYFEQGNTDLRDLFKNFANGERKTNPSDTGSLVYHDQLGGEERRIVFFGFTPLHYGSSTVDDCGLGQVLVETMEFSVLRYEIDTQSVPDILEDPIRDGCTETPSSRLFIDPNADAKDGVRRSAEEGAADDPAMTPKIQIFVDFNSPPGGDCLWQTVAGGGTILHPPESLEEPPMLEIEEFRLRGPLAPTDVRAELSKLINGWTVEGGDQPALRVELRNEQGEPLRAMKFGKVIPTFHQLPDVRVGDKSPLMEEFAFKPIQKSDLS